MKNEWLMLLGSFFATFFLILILEGEKKTTENLKQFKEKHKDE
jgi:hypothetical protein